MNSKQYNKKSIEKMKIMNEITQYVPPKCANPDCINLVEYYYKKDKWKIYCSNKCRGIFNSRNSREKAKVSYIKKYGTDTHLKNEEMKSRIKQTNIDIYGHASPFHNEEIKQKIKQTNLTRYGVENIFSLQTTREKVKRTNLEKFGNEYPQRLDTIKEKIKRTNLEKFGNEYPQRLDTIKEKIKRTNLTRYHRSSHFQQHISEESLNILSDSHKLSDLNQNMNTMQMGVHLGVSNTTISRYMKLHNIKLTPHFFSSGEVEIFNFIKCYYEDEIICRDKSFIDSELDILLPNHSFSIEYNGLYWHSEKAGKRDNNFHLDKTIKCATKNIRLLHIFESDWVERNDICKSMILSAIGKNAKVYAKNLKIVTVAKHIEVEFLTINNIDGFTHSSFCYGLVDNTGELYAVMSFIKSTKNKNYEYELLRFCNKNYVNVIGGASRLFKHFIKEHSPGSIISYCHRHLFSGNIYKTMGFTFSHFTKPSYWYTMDYNQLFNRMSFQKHKLKDKLEVFDDNLTEIENMNNNGYDRVWDCGNSVWGWRKL